MSKLDLIDRKLLHRLDSNARTPISQLAKLLRISRDMASYRIKRLEEEGIIKGYHAFIDASKLGYKLYRCYFKFYAVSKADHAALVKLLADNKRVFWFAETDGFIDIIFGVWAKDSLEFNGFYQKIIEQFRPVVKEEYVNELVSYSYLDRAYILSGKHEDRVEIKIGGGRTEKYDATDINVLNILSKNCRTPLIDIAKQLRMDSASIIYRIKQLEKKKIILGYKADIDIKRLNRSFYTVKLYLSDFKRKKQLETYLRSRSIVTNFTVAIGSWDVEFDLEVESDDEYHALIGDLKDKFEFISEIMFFRAPKIFKIINTPG